MNPRQPYKNMKPDPAPRHPPNYQNRPQAHSYIIQNNSKPMHQNLQNPTPHNSFGQQNLQHLHINQSMNQMGGVVNPAQYQMTRPRGQTPRYQGRNANVTQPNYSIDPYNPMPMIQPYNPPVAFAYSNQVLTYNYPGLPTMHPSIMQQMSGPLQAQQTNRVPGMPPNQAPISIPNDVIPNQGQIDTLNNTMVKVPQQSQPIQQNQSQLGPTPQPSMNRVKRETKAAVLSHPDTKEVIDILKLVQEPITDNPTSNQPPHNADNKTQPIEPTSQSTTQQILQANRQSEDQQIKVESANVKSTTGDKNDHVFANVNVDKQPPKKATEPPQVINKPVVSDEQAVKKDDKPVESIDRSFEQSKPFVPAEIKQENVTPPKRALPQDLHKIHKQQPRSKGQNNGRKSTSYDDYQTNNDLSIKDRDLRDIQAKSNRNNRSFNQTSPEMNLSNSMNANASMNNELYINYSHNGEFKKFNNKRDKISSRNNTRRNSDLNVRGNAGPHHSKAYNSSRPNFANETVTSNRTVGNPLVRRPSQVNDNSLNISHQASNKIDRSRIEATKNEFIQPTFNAVPPRPPSNLNSQQLSYSSVLRKVPPANPLNAPSPHLNSEVELENRPLVEERKSNGKESDKENMQESDKSNIQENVKLNIQENGQTNICVNVKLNIRENCKVNIQENVRTNIRENRKTKNRENIKANGKNKMPKDKIDISKEINNESIKYPSDESTKDASQESIKVDSKCSESSSKESSFTTTESSGTDEQTVSKPKETVQVQTSIVEDKIDKLKLTDSEPTVQKPEPVSNNKAQSDPNSGKPVNHVEKRVNELKDERISAPQQPIEELKIKAPVEHKVEQPPQPKSTPPQEPQQITVQPAQQPSNVKQTSKQQPNASTKGTQKRSNLEGSQSKSDSQNISYETDFLKSLQYSGLSIKKPDFQDLNGKVNEIILPETRPKNLQMDTSNEFDPHYRNSMGRYQDKQVPRKIISSNSLTQDVKLRTTENAWKPGRKRGDDESTESLLKQARGMLNKLTPQNFDRICSNFLKFNIDESEKLRKLIELIFDKAVDEPAFCDQYAQLCKKLSSISVGVEEGAKVKFNTLLLERCQTCFETDKYEGINIDERMKAINDCTDKEKKQLLIDELDEDKRRSRKKSLGNIKLIGALYEHNRLKDEIMDLCIETLIENGDEDSLECLCSLLKSIGEKFEKSTSNRAKFNQQMRMLEQVIRQKKIASRIKFLIMDVLDMRKDNWKLRKLQDGNKPKTIEQVHEEAKKREEESNREINQLGKRNDSIKKRSDNNWMNSNVQKSQTSGPDRISNIRRLNESNQNIGPINLGPTSFGSWSAGASGAKPSATNSFDRRPINKTPSRNDSRLDDSRSSSKKNPFRGSYTAGNENRDIDLMVQYSDAIKKYVESNEIEDLIKSIYDTSTEECVHIFVISAIDCACESLLKNIGQIGELLADFVIVKRIITHQQFHKGLKHHLDASQDVITDIPKFYEYVGQILSHFYFKISDDERRSFFKDALTPCLVFDTSIKIVAHLIKHAISRENELEVAKKWTYGKMSLTDFSDQKNQEQLQESLREHNLDKFLTELNKFANDESVCLSNLCNRILSDCSLDELPKLLKAHLSSTDKEMNKKLISALIERCIKESTVCPKSDQHSFDKGEFETKINKILPLDQLSDIELQLEIIQASVKVSNEFNNPKDFLLNILHFFVHDFKIVGKDALLRWRNEKKDHPGTAIAFITLKRFIEKFEKNDSMSNL